jgi:heme exporter protein D
VIPELGKYAGAVLGAYGITILLLAGLIGRSALRNARIRRALARIERRVQERPHGGT